MGGRLVNKSSSQGYREPLASPKRSAAYSNTNGQKPRGGQHDNKRMEFVRLADRFPVELENRQHNSLHPLRRLIPTTDGSDG